MASRQAALPALAIAAVDPKLVIGRESFPPGIPPVIPPVMRASRIILTGPRRRWRSHGPGSTRCRRVRSMAGEDENSVATAS